MQLRFVRSESTFSYFEALGLYLREHGAPIAFYSDKHSVFRVAKKDAKGGQGMTQFGRALCELNIEILCANSSQAKGRVERMNRTLQDRLVKALRLAHIDDMESGNAFLSNFMDRYNARFSIVPARSNDLHRPLNLAPDRLTEILCKREQRYVGSQLTFSFERKRNMLEETDVTRGLVGQYVETYAYADGRLDVRWKGLPALHGVRQGPASDACRDHREQAVGRHSGLYQGAPGSAGQAGCEEQQRQKRLQATRAQTRSTKRLHE